MSYEAVPELLEAMSQAEVARRLRRQVQPLRGIRGVPLGEVARIAAAAWEEQPPALPEQSGALSDLFATAFEDGLVGIGLLGSCVPDAPQAALELGLEWADRVDDGLTADALGWLVLGPALLATGGGLAHRLGTLRAHRRPEVRRAALSSGLAALPLPVEGPAAAPIRARLQRRRVRWVDRPHSAEVEALCTAHLRDEAPPVRKALRRLLRSWAQADPEAVLRWAQGAPGGLPRLLQPEIARARKRLPRREDPR